MPQVVTLRSDVQRAYACRLIMEAQDDSVVSIRGPGRTLEQNARMWAMLTELSKAEPRGLKYTPDEWKTLCMAACGWECQFLPGLLDGRPFPVGFRSSRMSKREMSALIDWIFAYGTENGVLWSEPMPEGASR